MSNEVDRKELEHQCRDCEFCSGGGLVTIYHERYEGLPSIRQTTPRGETRSVSLRAAVPCVCPLGLWIRERQEEASEAAKRQPRLERVIEGTIPWTIDDPTLPYYDPSELPDWSEFRRLIADKPIVTHAKSVLREVARKPFIYSPNPSRPDPILDPPKPVAVPVCVPDDDDSVPF